MTKKVYEHYEELIPEDKYITDLDETFVCEGLCAKTLDETQYKDITEKEAKEIMKRLEEEV